MIREALLAGAGGFAGSAARFLVSYAMAGCAAGPFLPWGTLAVNASGSLLIGVLMAVVGSGSWYFLLVAGFCGGFTTFSAFSYELLGMLKQQQYLQSSLYVAVSVVLCVGLVWLGMWAGGQITKIQ